MLGHWVNGVGRRLWGCRWMGGGGFGVYSGGLLYILRRHFEGLWVCSVPYCIASYWRVCFGCGVQQVMDC